MTITLRAHYFVAIVVLKTYAIRRGFVPLRSLIRMEKNINKLVEVEWLDAQSGFSFPLSIEELEKEEPLHTFSTGYLLTEDDKKIILGFMMFGGEDFCKHWQLIPKGMIIKITELIRTRHEA